MARTFYGGSPADVLAQVSADDGDYAPAAETLTVWDAATAGTQVTDLLDVESVPASTVTPDSYGRISFFGPDAFTGPLWVQDSGGKRWRIDPSTLAARVQAVEATNATQTTDISNRQPLDSDLTAIAALTTTAYGRGFLSLADQAALMALLAAASETVQGKVQLASAAETTTGTDTVRVTHPAGVKAALDAVAATLQPLDADLTAVAGLATTAYGRAFLTLAGQAGLVALIPVASETVQGLVELATTTEATTGTDTARAVTPAGLKASVDATASTLQPLDADLTAIAGVATTAYGRAFLALANQSGLVALLPTASETVQGLVELATAAEVVTGTDTTRAVTPAGLKTVTDALAPKDNAALTGTLTLNGQTISPDATVVDITKVSATLNTGTTFATEPELQLAVGANQVWDVYVIYVLRGDATNDAKIDVQGPGGATLVGQLYGQYQGDAAQVEAITAFGESHTVNTKGTTGDTDKTVVSLSFRISTAATAGTVTFRLAKNTNTVTTTDLTVMAGSFLRAQRTV